MHYIKSNNINLINKNQIKNEFNVLNIKKINEK